MREPMSEHCDFCSAVSERCHLPIANRQWRSRVENLGGLVPPRGSGALPQWSELGADPGILQRGPSKGYGKRKQNVKLLYTL